MKLLTRTAAIVALAAAVSSASAQGLTGETDTSAGHRLALLLCAPCHVVASDQESPPTLAKPAATFLSIANRRNVTAESLRAFLRTTHSTTTPPFKMPNPQLADYQTDAIVSYPLSLKGQH